MNREESMAYIDEVRELLQNNYDANYKNFLQCKKKKSYIIKNKENKKQYFELKALAVEQKSPLDLKWDRIDENEVTDIPKAIAWLGFEERLPEAIFDICIRSDKYKDTDKNYFGIVNPNMNSILKLYPPRGQNYGFINEPLEEDIVISSGENKFKRRWENKEDYVKAHMEWKNGREKILIGGENYIASRSLDWVLEFIWPYATKDIKEAIEQYYSNEENFVPKEDRIRFDSFLGATAIDGREKVEHGEKVKINNKSIQKKNKTFDEYKKEADEAASCGDFSYFKRSIKQGKAVIAAGGRLYVAYKYLTTTFPIADCEETRDLRKKSKAYFLRANEEAVDEFLNSAAFEDLLWVVKNIELSNTWEKALRFRFENARETKLSEWISILDQSKADLLVYYADNLSYWHVDEREIIENRISIFKKALTPERFRAFILRFLRGYYSQKDIKSNLAASILLDTFVRCLFAGGISRLDARREFNSLQMCSESVDDHRDFEEKLFQYAIERKDY
jgi:hypothetical protein